MLCKQCKRPIDQRKPFVGIPVRTHTGQTSMFHYHTGCYDGEISKCRPMGRYQKNLTRDGSSTWKQKRTAWGQSVRTLPMSKRIAMRLKGELPITNPVDYIDRIQKEEWPKKTKYKPTSKAIVPYWRGKVARRNPSRLDPWDKMERVRDHELHRIRTMSKSALYTRIGKMNRPEKLRMFIQIARERNEVALAREAMARLRELGYRANPGDKKVYQCPHCFKTFPYTKEGRDEAKYHIPGCSKNPRYKQNPLLESIIASTAAGMAGAATFVGLSKAMSVAQKNPRKKYRRNPLTKQEIDELESQRDAYFEMAKALPLHIPRRHFLRGKATAIHDVTRTYDGQMNLLLEMGKWAGHKKNPGSNIKLVLKRKAETDEWVVAWYENGKYSEAKTYYTNDKQDAIDTMAFLKKKYGIAQANPYALDLYGRMKREQQTNDILYNILDWLIVEDKLPYPGAHHKIETKDYIGEVETNKDGSVFLDIIQVDDYDNEIFSGYGTIPKWEIKYAIEQLDKEHKLPKTWGYNKNPSRQFYGRSEILGPTCPKCKTPRMRIESTYSGQKYTCAKCGHSFDSYHPNPRRQKGRRSTMEANPRRVRGVPTIRAAELISGLSPGFLYLIQRVIKNYKPGQYGQYQLWPTDMGVEVRDKISHKVKFFIHYNLSRRIDEVIEDFETRYSYHKPKIVYSRALLHKFEPALEPAIVEYKDITIPQKKEYELKANKTYVYWIEKKMKIPWTQYLLLTPEEQAKLEYEFDRVLHLRRYRPEKKTKNYVIEKTDSYAIGISILPGKVYRGWIGNEAGIKYSSAYRFVEQALEWIEARGYTIPEKVKRMLKRALPSIPVLESQPHIPMPKAKRAELKTFEPTESGAVEEDIMKNAQANPSTPTQKEVEVAAAKAEEFHATPPSGLKKVKVPNLKEGVLVKLGIWPSTTYFSSKWKKKNQKFAGKDGQLYIHEWGDDPKHQKNRVVAFKPDKTDPNKGWVVAWGRGRLTPHGIEDLKK